jgi:hypothetical protein
MFGAGPWKDGRDIGRIVQVARWISDFLAILTV